VKCKFYYNNDLELDLKKQRGVVFAEDQNQRMSQLMDNKKYTEVSFMIFRTGSCLIVGNCSERILYLIFDFIKHILTTEYEEICVVSDEPVLKNKKSKIRKRNISVSNDYLTIISG
jgi:hypothetical protein